MKLTHLAFPIYLSLVFTGYAQAQIDPFGQLELGPYAVGARELSMNNDSESPSRRINIFLWYPAKETSGQSLTYADYLDYKDEIPPDEMRDEISFGIGGKKELLPNDSLDLMLNAEMAASGNAPVQSGSFPLLLWSSRYGTVEYQSIISEYLASHGFVVAFAEDIPNSPYPWALPSAEDRKSTLMRHVSDLNAALDFLKELPETDGDKIGMLAWSYAGESAILTQINNTDVDVVVGLSAISLSSGVYLRNDFSNEVDLTRVNVPYLILSERIGTNGQPRSAPANLDDMHVATRYVSFRDLSHGNFNALEGMIPGLLRTNKVQSWSKGADLARQGYELVCQLSLSFLQSVFSNADTSSFDDRVNALKSDLQEGYFTVHMPARQ